MYTSHFYFPQIRKTIIANLREQTNNTSFYGMEEFTTEKLIRKLGKSEGFSIVLICFGIFYLFLQNWTAIYNFRSLFNFLSAFTPLLFGTVILINNANRIKKLRGSYVKISNQKVAFKSRGVEYHYDDSNPLESIEIRLYEIVFTETDGTKGTLYLEDYIGDGEQKKIKELLAINKENLKVR